MFLKGKVCIHIFYFTSLFFTHSKYLLTQAFYRWLNLTAATLKRPTHSKTTNELVTNMPRNNNMTFRVFGQITSEGVSPFIP